MLQSLRSHRRPFRALASLGALALLLLVLLVAMPGAKPASAQTRTGHDFTYYDDANHTNVVGYYYWCVGYNGGWGAHTSYVEIGDFPCS
jgi:hypothetical protein